MRPEGSVTLTWHLLSAQVGNTSPRSGGRSVGIVRSRTQTMELSYEWLSEWASSHSSAEVVGPEVVRFSLSSKTIWKQNYGKNKELSLKPTELKPRLTMVARTRNDLLQIFDVSERNWIPVPVFFCEDKLICAVCETYTPNSPLTHIPRRCSVSQ
jgi:hypothetical protein